MNSSIETTDIILNTINSIFEKLFSSIDNELYSILDDLIFISSDILYNDNFLNIIGKSPTNGILLVSNSLLIGFVLFYSIKYLISHLNYNKIESPSSFIFNIIIFGLIMNFSFDILKLILDLNSYISLSIRAIGEELFHISISFSELITNINKTLSINFTSFNIFSIDGLIKSTLSFSLLNLIFSYSLRYVLIEIFILISPFAFLSLSLSSTSFFFKVWIKNFFSLLLIQHIVSLTLVLIFSLNLNSNNLLNKFIYLGGLYSLIKANSFVREFIGGISTNVSTNVHNFTNFFH